MHPICETASAPQLLPSPQVLSGEIAPDVLLGLPPEELASDAKKEENARIREKKLFDAAPSSVKQARSWVACMLAVLRWFALCIWERKLFGAALLVVHAGGCPG